MWLGPTLPSWFELSLSITRLFNPSIPIYLLSDHPHTHVYLKKLSVQTYTLNFLLEDLPIAHSPSDNLFQFWQNSSKRFFYLHYFADLYHISSFFHAELDNIIFDISSLHLRLDRYQGLFAPQDSPSRAIASLIYVNHIESLQDLLRCYTQSTVTNDMAALGLFASSQNRFYPLPTESSYAASISWSPLKPEECHGIFDAATLGQYLFGIPKYHTPYSPSRNHTINENCLIDPSQIRLVSLFPLVIVHPNYPHPLRLYNLHVHSKQFSYISSLFFNDRFSLAFNSGAQVTLSRSYMLVLSPLRRVIKPLIDISTARLKKIWHYLLLLYVSLIR